MTVDIFPHAEKYPLITKDPLLFKLKKKPGGHTVYMIMDDPENFALGGNKVRFYEYLIPEIKASGAECLITTGSIYSNHIRVTAEVAKMLGMKCRLIITDDYPGDEFFEHRSNLSIVRDMGADITYAGSFAAMLKTEEYKKEMLKEGIRFFHVPNAGHSKQAVMAYANVFLDAMERLSAKGIMPERLFLPVASGTTLSGVLAGKACLRALGGRSPHITAYAVGNSVPGAIRAVQNYLADAEVLKHLQPDLSQVIEKEGGTVGSKPATFEPASLSDEYIDIRDCGKNNYGNPDWFLRGMRIGVRRDEGVLLDPTYNTNAFYGMLKDIENHPGKSPVLYLNTGGFLGWDDKSPRNSIFSQLK